MPLQPVFPTPAIIAIPEELKQKPAKLHKQIFHVLDDHTTDVEMIGDAAKIIRDSYGTASRIKGKEINPGIVTHMNAIADTFEFLEIFSYIKTLVHLSQKKRATPYKKKMYALKTTSAVFSLAYSVMSGVKLVNELILDKLGKGALTYGKVPVFGLPFGAVFGLFDLVRTTLDAVISTFKLRKHSTELSHTSKKIKNRWKQPIDAAFAKAKIARLENKQAGILKGAHALCRVIETSPKGLKLTGELAILKKHYSAGSEKLEKWEKLHQKLKVGTLNSKQLEGFRKEKLEKWKIKKVNLNWRIGKEILSLILSCVTILFLFASIVLGFTSLAAAPAFLLTCSIISLSLSIGYFAKHLLIKHKEDTPYKKVGIPALA